MNRYDILRLFWSIHLSVSLINKTLFLHRCYLGWGWVLVIDKNPKEWVVTFEGNSLRILTGLEKSLVKSLPPPEKNDYIYEQIQVQRQFMFRFTC